VRFALIERRLGREEHRTTVFLRKTWNKKNGERRIWGTQWKALEGLRGGLVEACIVIKVCKGGGTDIYSSDTKSVHWGVGGEKCRRVLRMWVDGQSSIGDVCGESPSHVRVLEEHVGGVRREGGSQAKNEKNLGNQSRGKPIGNHEGIEGEGLKQRRSGTGTLSQRNSDLE